MVSIKRKKIEIDVLKVDLLPSGKRFWFELWHVISNNVAFWQV